MAVDILQEKIRKTKNPSMLELCLLPSQLPPHLLTEEESASGAYLRMCRELLAGLKGLVPAVRVSFASFALLGAEGVSALEQVLSEAGKLGYYVLLEAPEFHSPSAAAMTAEAIFGEGSRFACDGVLMGMYEGSDVIKPFLPYCVQGKKDVFCVVRTANKSAPELQDLLAGSRQVHLAAADHVNRYGMESAGKFGYTRVGIMAAASTASGLTALRSKYPKLFMILDGYDYPNANAKNCSRAFDRFGHGAVACAGTSITCAWKEAESDGSDYLEYAVAAAERMKKNLTRYVSIM